MERKKKKKRLGCVELERERGPSWSAALHMPHANHFVAGAKRLSVFPLKGEKKS